MRQPPPRLYERQRGNLLFSGLYLYYVSTLKAKMSMPTEYERKVSACKSYISWLRQYGEKQGVRTLNNLNHTLSEMRPEVKEALGIAEGRVRITLIDDGGETRRECQALLEDAQNRSLEPQEIEKLMVYLRQLDISDIEESLKLKARIKASSVCKRAFIVTEIRYRLAENGKEDLSDVRLVFEEGKAILKYPVVSDGTLGGVIGGVIDAIIGDNEISLTHTEQEVRNAFSFKNQREDQEQSIVKLYLAEEDLQKECFRIWEKFEEGDRISKDDYDKLITYLARLDVSGDHEHENGHQLKLILKDKIDQILFVAVIWQHLPQEIVIPNGSVILIESISTANNKRKKFKEFFHLEDDITEIKLLGAGNTDTEQAKALLTRVKNNEELNLGDILKLFDYMNTVDLVRVSECIKLRDEIKRHMPRIEMMLLSKPPNDDSKLEAKAQDLKEKIQEKNHQKVDQLIDNLILYRLENSPNLCVFLDDKTEVEFHLNDGEFNSIFERLGLSRQTYSHYNKANLLSHLTGQSGLGVIQKTYPKQFIKKELKNALHAKIAELREKYRFEYDVQRFVDKGVIKNVVHNDRYYEEQLEANRRIRAPFLQKFLIEYAVRELSSANLGKLEGDNVADLKVALDFSSIEGSPDFFAQLCNYEVAGKGKIFEDLDIGDGCFSDIRKGVQDLTGIRLDKNHLVHLDFSSGSELSTSKTDLSEVVRDFIERRNKKNIKDAFLKRLAFSAYEKAYDLYGPENISQTATSEFDKAAREAKKESIFRIQNSTDLTATTTVNTRFIKKCREILNLPEGATLEDISEKTGIDFREGETLSIVLAQTDDPKNATLVRCRNMKETISFEHTSLADRITYLHYYAHTTARSDSREDKESKTKTDIPRASPELMAQMMGNPTSGQESVEAAPQQQPKNRSIGAAILAGLWYFFSFQWLSLPWKSRTSNDDYERALSTEDPEADLHDKELPDSTAGMHKGGLGPGNVHEQRRVSTGSGGPWYTTGSGDQQNKEKKESDPKIGRRPGPSQTSE